VNRELKLVGVGSLLVRESVEPGNPVPGNMFVPIDLLKPILAELKAQGRTKETPRPWLGLNTEVVHGRLFVTRVSPEGPAAQAGVRRGDVVIGVAGVPVKTHAELYRKLWSLGAAGVEVPIRILQDGDVRDVQVKSIDRTQYFKSKPAY
jgi:S1-C subfamily serine protease